MCFSQKLLRWYDQNRRVLPWRGTSDPYRIWISEIMLQQTRSETVIHYYERFLRNYPTVFDLASAPIDDVLKLWEGLGYYSRARNLHKCARVVAESGGVFPASADELEALPGIGPYAARAIASIAYNEPVPALDGNQMRIISRVFAVEDVLKTPFDLKSEAMELLSTDRPGDYNQALMDLGATVCTPKRPACDICPVSEECMAFRENEPERYPLRPVPVPKKDVDLTILIIETPEGICVRKREGQLLGGLYEFPAFEGHVSAEDLVDWLTNIGCTNTRHIRTLPASKHVFTHLIWHMIGYSLISDTVPAGFIACSSEVLNTYAFPNALRVYRGAAEELADQTASATER